MTARSPGKRAAITFADQAVSSMSNFATGLVIARLSGPAEFGRYMLVFTIWVVVVGLHRAVITDAVIVMSRDSDADRPLLSRGVSAELLLGSLVSVVVASGGVVAMLGGSPVGRLMLAVAPWFVSLLLQDYWRAMAFQQRQPGLALANDSVFAMVQFAAIGVFWAVGATSAGDMIAAWGIGATAGSLLGLRMFPCVARLGDGRRLLIQLWPMSRWMLADFVTGFASQQAYLVFVYLLLSQTNYGGLRAATLLMGPSIVIVHAGANVGLPEASRRFAGAEHRELRRFAARLTAVTLIAITAYGGVVTVFGSRLLDVLFGPEFQRFSLLVTLAALQTVLLVSVFGPATALKAAGRMRALWRARMLVSVASLITTVILVRISGTVGAAWGGVATATYYAVAVFLVYRSELVLAGDRGSDGVPVPPLITNPGSESGASSGARLLG